MLNKEFGFPEGYYIEIHGELSASLPRTSLYEPNRAGKCRVDIYENLDVPGYGQENIVNHVRRAGFFVVDLEGKTAHQLLGEIREGIAREIST